MRSGKGQQRASNQADGRRPSSTRDSIQQLERDRETRRQVVASKRASKAQEIANHTAAGLVGDVDFMRAIRSFRVERQDDSQEHSLPGDSKVCVCVRKRPINEKELRKNDHGVLLLFLFLFIDMLSAHVYVFICYQVPTLYIMFVCI